MGETSVDYLSQLAGCYFSHDWGRANTIVEAMRADWGDIAADFYSDYTRAQRLEVEGKLRDAAAQYQTLRLRVEGWLDDDDDDDDDANDDGRRPLTQFKLIAEYRELTVSLAAGGHPSKSRARIEAKAKGIMEELWARRTEHVQAKLAGADIPGVGRILIEVFGQTPLLAVMFDYFEIVQMSPNLLNRPAMLKRGLVGLMHTAFGNEVDIDKEVVFPWVARPKNRSAFNREQHIECTRLLVDSPRIRALHRLFCDSWRKGSDSDRHLEIRKSHIDRLMLNAYAKLWQRGYRAGELAAHEEERIEAWANMIHTTVELVYKHALIALCRLERGTDDLTKVPQNARQLGCQLRDQWRSRGEHELADLIDMDVLIIRNAVAHEHVHAQFDGRVVYTSTSAKGVVSSVGPLTAEEVEQKFQALLERIGDIFNAFNYILPPRGRGGVFPLS